MDGLQKLRKRGKNEILAETRENERSICIYELVATCLCLVATCLCFSRYVFVFSCYEVVIESLCLVVCVKHGFHGINQGLITCSLSCSLSRSLSRSSSLITV